MFYQKNIHKFSNKIDYDKRKINNDYDIMRILKK